MKSQETKTESAKPKTIMNFFNPSTKDKEKEVSKKEGNIPSSSSAASGVTTSTSNNMTTGAVVVAAAVAPAVTSVTSGKSNLSTAHTSLSAALANPPSAMVTPAPPAAKTVQPPPQVPPQVPPSGSIHTGSVSETVPSHIFEPVLSPAQTRLAKLLEHGMPIIKHGKRYFWTGTNQILII
jgi:hypothetical protein